MDLLKEVSRMISEAGGCENLAAEIILENSEYYTDAEKKEAMLLLSDDTIKRILFAKDTAKSTDKYGRQYTWTHRELVFLKDNWDILPLSELSRRLRKPQVTINNAGRLFFGNKVPVIHYYQKLNKTG